ncbi:Efflux transporter, RND family, MFP subunit [Candidatus Filomicrobium marinum]|uniref:Efflux transporter, RND family, MFP subunit n=1 Tax=Candidatus Filomicrobium marinum TaxID=1608628 RepID=A0A0D6JDN6_9HYPH|nr:MULTISPECIES: efflux RND transporter periplasmic adaptor subunit [Filomicrobium]MCV0368128.1 efflux RND transporter periplasmic adaptor subunit [Filomicrobium sp.]CFX14361.1 Efflux transporter, RND family, MFP subunit [Candidatus Filomicrobium marinum]CPR17778.1 Efflux transporter, RND family, MFP subunit [Candidatus Filomicrobium marinum]
MLRALLCSTVTSILALGPAFAAGEQSIAVSPKQVENLEIKLAETKPATSEALALLPATVVSAMNQHIAATAPFSGTVVQNHVLPGQYVKKGDALATLASRELLETLSQIAQSEAELQMARAIAERKRTLADKQIYSPTMAAEAEAHVAKIAAVLEQNRKAVSMGGIKLGAPGQYTIVAANDGRVDEVSALPGAAVEANAPVATLVLGDEIWIEAQVSADLVTKIRPGDKVQVVDGPIGVVVSIGGSLDKLTRSAKLLARLPTDARLLRGEMVTISVMREATMGSLEVPASAVSWINDHHAVFVRQNSGFRLAPVSVNGRSQSSATVTGDLTAGEMVAASGLPQLQFILEGN